MGVQINGDTGNVIATKGTYSGNVTIGGTLTYEDVTNIDSVGLVTARQGIEVGSGVGVAASISVDGNAEFAGIVTATSFKGDGSNLTGIDATQIVTGNTSVQTVDTGSDGHVKINTEGSERVRVFSDGNVQLCSSSGIGNTNPAFSGSTSGGLVRIDGTTPTLYMRETDRAMGAQDFYIGRSTRTVYIGNQGGDIIFQTSASGSTTASRVSIAASDGFMTNVNPVFCIKPTNGSQSSPNGVNTKIQFAEHVITERGSGVDFTNNRYVAPIGGYYHFSYTVYTYYCSLTYIDVQKNGSIFHRNWGLGVTNQANPYTTTGSLTMLLVKGDYIELFSQVSTTSDGYIFSASTNPTIFMGHLIG